MFSLPSSVLIEFGSTGFSALQANIFPWCAIDGVNVSVLLVIAFPAPPLLASPEACKKYSCQLSFIRIYSIYVLLFTLFNMIGKNNYKITISE